MDSKAPLTVDIIAKVAEGKINIINAAKLLNKSRRTIERYLQKYQIKLESLQTSDVKSFPVISRTVFHDNFD